MIGAALNILGIAACIIALLTIAFWAMGCIAALLLALTHRQPMPAPHVNYPVTIKPQWQISEDHAYACAARRAAEHKEYNT